MSIPFVTRSSAACLRYGHAQTHLKLLNEHLQKAGNLDNFELLEIPNDPHGRIIRFKQWPPVILSLVFGDVIHSWRSALDYITCALVTLNTPEADLTRIQFPFGKKDQRLNRDQRRSVDGISERGLEIIEDVRLQCGEYLSLLCDFSNQDKHRLLLPAYIHLVPHKFVVSEKTLNSTVMSVQPQGFEMSMPIQDGDRVEFSGGHLMGLMIGFQLERGGRSYGVKDINKINAAVRESLDALISLLPQAEQD
ncbi:MAG: hypothetical protein ABF443_13150 [Acetobacter malorum]|uniref:hypothetical protein n=1 Tax=Acetobacter malorum TaxID=178901 RepID=UPI0039EA78F9